jgi:hypothetical protein
MCGFAIGTITATSSIIIANTLDFPQDIIMLQIVTIGGVVYMFVVVKIMLYSFWKKYVEIK